MPRDYIPQNDAQLNAWAANFGQKLGLDPARFGAPASAVAEFQALSADFAAKLAMAADPATRTCVSIADKRAGKAPLIAQARLLARIIHACPATTDPMRAELGLTVRDRADAGAAAGQPAGAERRVDRRPARRPAHRRCADADPPGAPRRGAAGGDLRADRRRRRGAAGVGWRVPLRGPGPAVGPHDRVRRRAARPERLGDRPLDQRQGPGRPAIGPGAGRDRGVSEREGVRGRGQGSEKGNCRFSIAD